MNTARPAACWAVIAVASLPMTEARAATADVESLPQQMPSDAPVYDGGTDTDTDTDTDTTADGDSDDGLGEFDDAFAAFEPYATQQLDAADHAGGLPLRGDVAIEAAYQTSDAPRWQRLGCASRLLLDIDSEGGSVVVDGTARLNAAYDLENDPPVVGRRYRLELVLREAYWSRAFGPVTVTIGNQTVVWGKADALPITDVMSPRDQTALLFARPSETRLGQNVIALDAYGDGRRLSLLLVPYPMFNRTTPPAHPYGLIPREMLQGLRLRGPPARRGVEMGVRAEQSFGGGEVAVLAGYVHNREPLIELHELFVRRAHVRYGLVGITGNLAWSSLLVKFEMAYGHDQPHQGFPEPSVRRESTGSAMLGVDYVHADWGTLLLEIAYSTATVAPDPSASTDRGSYTAAVGWNDSFLRDDLTLSVFALAFDDPRDLIVRLDASVQLHDAWALAGQLTHIRARTRGSLLSAFAQLDRADVTLTYAWDLAT